MSRSQIVLRFTQKAPKAPESLSKNHPITHPRGLLLTEAI